ncbi:MAG TPA: hypothetical protein VH062_11615 [Polyangiaceae bacterium]|nr:hypothetical protein [Polyangiaceae bacterium]
MLVAGFVLTVAASRVTGPTFDEEHRLQAVHRATELVRAVTDFGPSALGSSSAEAIYDEMQPFGPLPTLISGWFGEVLAAAHLMDRLVAARLGWLLLTGTAPAALYFMVVRSHGPRVAALAACLLLAMPRWLHGAASAREPVVVASIWLVLLALYVQSIAPARAARRRGVRAPFRGAAFVFALALGLGISTSLATLWVLPLIVVHSLVARPRHLRRSLRQGMLPLPFALLAMIVVSPVTLVAAGPSLWQGGAHAAAWFLSPLAPSIEPLLYRGGPIVSPRDVPGGYALRWLVATTPALVLALAFAGAGVIAAEYWAARRVRRDDAVGLGSLLVLAVFAIVFGPALTPAVFTRFPPRVEAALPFIAAAAAIPVVRAASRAVGEQRGVFVVLVAGVLFVTSGLIGVPTASSSFGLFGGGTARAVESRMWTVGDGSEVAPLAAAIDKLGMPRLAIDAPEVPRTYWQLLQRDGRLHTQVEPGRAGALTVSVNRGPHAGALATVARDGATLWSLTRR